MSNGHEVFEFPQGATWEIAGALKDAAGAALDLSGVTIEWTLKNSSYSLSLTTVDGITIVDAAAGTILINVVPASSAVVPLGVYEDSLKVTLVDGAVSYQWAGPVRVGKAPDA